MGNNIGSAVNKGITREQFQASLSRNGIKGDKFDSAMTIFDHYAAANTSAEGENANQILDEQEQVMARSEFAQFNQDDDNNVGKREFNNNGGKESTFKNYDVAKIYMEAMEHAASHSGNETNVGEMVVTDNGAVVTYGANTSDTSDDAITIYDSNGNEVQLEAEPQVNDLEEVVVPDEDVNTPEPPKFESEAEVKTAVIKYLLGGQDIGDVDTGFMQLDGLECTLNEDKTATVRYGDKTYTVRINESNATVKSEYVFENDDGDGTTLQQAILNSESTDTEHHYYNRGRKGNLKSTYNAETGEITNNSGTGRQGVSQVQTFSSMLMNGNENTTLKLDGQIQTNGSRKALDGATIIDSLDTGGENADGEISMGELVKFLRAAVNEAGETVTAARPGTPGGSRIYAPGVDLDLKDIANLGKVFDAMDRDGNGKLNAEELDELIAKLTNGQSMSSIAGKTSTYTYQGAPDAHETPEPTKPEPVKHELELGDVATIDKTRNNIQGGSVNYTYSGGAGGTRTMVATGADGKTHLVTNANIVENSDHGLFGWGKKDFFVVYGLDQNVRAELISGNDARQTIKVKDSNGNETYKRVEYDANTQTYSLSPEEVTKDKDGKYRTTKERIQDGLQKLGLETDVKLPRGLKFDYDKDGNVIFKFNGSEIRKEVALIMIRKVNVETD